MDAVAYQMSFNKEQLALLCANYDRRIDSVGAENKRLKAENAKLRELVRELWTYAEQELLCDENCSYGAVCDWRNCVFEGRMRELGVVTDGQAQALH